MTDDEKKAAETAEAEAKAEKEKADAEFEASLEGLSDEEKAEKRKEKIPNIDIDYEAELKKEREAHEADKLAREKAEQALAERRFKESEKKRKEDEGEEEEEKPLTAKGLQEILVQERLQTEKQLQKVHASEIAGSLATSEAEKALILEIYNNTTFSNHLSLEEQIEASFAVANRKKLIGENTELKRALKGKAGVSTDSATTHHDSQKSTKTTLSSDIRNVLVQQGFALNNSTGRYEKKVGKGMGSATLIADPKTGAISRKPL